MYFENEGIFLIGQDESINFETTYTEFKGDLATEIPVSEVPTLLEHNDLIIAPKRREAALKRLKEKYPGRESLKFHEFLNCISENHVQNASTFESQMREDFA